MYGNCVTDKMDNILWCVWCFNRQTQHQVKVHINQFYETLKCFIPFVWRNKSVHFLGSYRELIWEPSADVTGDRWIPGKYEARDTLLLRLGIYRICKI